MKMTDAEKAYEVAVARKDTGSPREAFVAGRISRDAEVAELREQLAACEVTLLKADQVMSSAGFLDSPWYEYAGSFTPVTRTPAISSAPSSTGGANNAE